MIKYIIKRVLMGALTLFVLATITFFGVHAMPGDPFSQDNKVIPADVFAAMEAKFALDKPLGTQYVIYLKNALQGDFGMSINTMKNQQISDIIKTRFPETAKLGIVAFLVAMILGLLLGIIAALSKKRIVNGAVTVFATLGVSMPSFLFAMIIMIFFCLKIKLFPVSGLDTPLHFVLPSFAIALSSVSMVTRLTRSSVRDELNKDYVTLARSKGIPERQVTVRHALKNALLPVITYAGPMFASLVTGSLVIENLFNIHGIGKVFTASIQNRDYPLVMGITLFYGLLVIVMNIVSDVAAAMVDPRIKLEK